MNEEETIDSKKFDIASGVVSAIVVVAIALCIFVNPKYFVARYIFVLVNFKAYFLAFIGLIALSLLSAKIVKLSKLVQFGWVLFLVALLVGPFQYV